MPVATEAMQKRQRAILAIVRNRRVARQAELVRLLRERGIRATQSSVSRDLQQLGITKLDSRTRKPTAMRRCSPSSCATCARPGAT